MIMRNLFVLFLLFSIFAPTLAYSAEVNAYFRDPYDPSGTDYHFNTRLQFNTAYTISLVSGEALYGANPANIQNNDSVCIGSVLRVTPQLTSRWGVGDSPSSPFDIGAWLYDCDSRPAHSGDCPLTPGRRTAVTPHEIYWLGPDFFNALKTTGDRYSYTSDRGVYTLFPFYNERTTYINSTGTYANRDGGANVFCRGAVELREGGTTHSVPLPFSGGASSSADFSMTLSGNHIISARLVDASCLGIAVKYPIDPVPAPGSGDQDFFIASYYTLNQPTIPTADSVTTTVRVVAPTGTCSLTGSETTIIPIDDTHSVVRVNLHTTGAEPIAVHSVSSSDPQYTVVPFDRSVCSGLTLPEGIVCPDSSGFDELFSLSNHYVLVLVTSRTPSIAGETTLTFNARTTTATCGVFGTCSYSTSVKFTSTSTAGCRINPQFRELGTYVVRSFAVECYGGANCTGGRWYWSGVPGGFTSISEDGTRVSAYTSAPAGSSGTLHFRTSGTSPVDCSAQINATTPDYVCTLAPNPATVNISSSQAFTLTSLYIGRPAFPTVVDYSILGGFSGSLHDSSPMSVIYDAPSTMPATSSGTIQAYPQFFGDDGLGGAGGDVVGMLCFASVNLVTGAPTNLTNASNYTCSLTPASATLNFSDSRSFNLSTFYLGIPSRPSIADYSLIDGLAGSVSGIGISGINGVTYTASDSVSSGRIMAHPQFFSEGGPAADAYCFASIDVVNGSTTIPPINPDGSTQWCTIGTGTLTVYPGYQGWLGIRCGAGANETCPSITWSVPEGGISFPSSSRSGTYLFVTGMPGQSGRIIATIADEPDRTCSKPFTIGTPICWEVS